MPKQPVVELQTSIIESKGRRLIAISLINLSSDPVSVVTLASYLRVELKDARGQFVTGTKSSGGLSFPSKNDYAQIDSKATLRDAIELEIAAAQIGDFAFPAIPKKTVVRITYKADGIMPGLPARLKPSFFGGPTKPVELELELP